MARTQYRWWTPSRVLIHAIALLAIIHFVACSAQRSSSTDSGNTYDPYSTDPNQFDPTQTGTNNNNNSNSGNYGNIFDTQVNNDDQSQYQEDSKYNYQPTADELACLTSDSGFGVDSDFQWTDQTSQNSTSSAACFNGQSSLAYDQLFDTSYRSYGMMSFCLELALSRAPQSGASGQSLQMAFAQARMAMVRCYKLIVGWESGSYNWSDYSLDSYSYTNNNLNYMLNQFQWIQ